MDILREGGVILQCKLNRHITPVMIDVNSLFDEFFTIDIKIINEFNKATLRKELLGNMVLLLAVAVLCSLTPVSECKKDIFVKERQLTEPSSQDIKLELYGLEYGAVRHESGYCT